jgi:hypothetical protein
MIREWVRLRERRHLVGRVAKVLARGRRGGVLHDERRMRDISIHLDLQWQARELHPWDLDLSQERQAEIFAIQLLEDTVMMIRQLFGSLPEVDAIHIRVLEPLQSQRMLLEGTVSRATFQGCHACQSPAMSLKLLGICYKLTSGRLEPLDKPAA